MIATLEIMKSSIVKFTILILFVSLSWATDEVNGLRRELLEALDSEALDSMAQSAKFSQTGVEANQALLDLLESLPPTKDGVPVSEIMTSEQASQFGMLQQKAKLPMMVSWVGSRRQRDVEVVSQLLLMTFSEQDWDRRPSSDSSNAATHQKIIEGLDAALNILPTEELDKLAEVKAFEKDRVIIALDKLFERQSNSAVNEMETMLESLQLMYRSRTGKAEFDATDLNEEEIEFRDESVREFKKTYTPLVRLQGIRLLYSMATLENHILEEEVITTGGDYSAVESEMREMTQSWGQSGQFFLGLVWMINEDIPADFVEDFATKEEEMEGE